MGTETALYCFLLPKVVAFRKQYPQITVRITDQSTAETITAVRSGAVDVGVAVSPLGHFDDLTMRKVMEYRDIFIGGGTFSGLRGRVISTGEIAGLPFVGVDQSANEHLHLVQWFEEQGLQFEPEYVVRTSTMVIPFVAGGLAVSVLPEPLLREFIKVGKIFEIQTEKAMPPRQIYLVYRKNSQPSMLCRRFVEYLG